MRQYSCISVSVVPYNMICVSTENFVLNSVILRKLELNEMQFNLSVNM